MIAPASLFTAVGSQDNMDVIALQQYPRCVRRGLEMRLTIGFVLALALSIPAEAVDFRWGSSTTMGTTEAIIANEMCMSIRFDREPVKKSMCKLLSKEKAMHSFSMRFNGKQTVVLE